MEEIKRHGERGPDPRSPLCKAYGSAAMPSAPLRLAAGWERGDNLLRPNSSRLPFTTTFVPCFPASFFTLRIPGGVIPLQLAKGKEVEVPIYLSGKIPPHFKTLF